MAITVDIGAAAIDRATRFWQASLLFVLIEGTKPATVAGKIVKIAVYMSDTGNLRFGTFYKTNGNSFTCRDYTAWKAAFAGYNEIDVSLDAEIGDYIGCLLDNTTGIDHDTVGGTEYWYVQTNDIALSDTACTYTSGAVNSIGGELGTAPTVTTQAVSSIAATTATGNGNITDLGSPNPTAHGVCWNTTGTPTTADDSTDEGAASATGAFTTAMTSLVSGTKYYVRAYAKNDVGTAYGAEVEFVAGETIYPADDVARVSSIRHICLPGSNRMVLGLGDLGLDVDIAETAVRSALETAKDIPWGKEMFVWRRPPPAQPPSPRIDRRMIPPLEEEFGEKFEPDVRFGEPESGG